MATLAWAVSPCSSHFCTGSWRARWRGRPPKPRRDATWPGWFVLTLVPIGIAYHLAHYHSLLLVAGQYAIPLLSDPFGYGWDLFGTTLYLVDFSVVDAASIWYLSVGAIIVGHVVAVYLAHVMALRVYGNARTALQSQIPMLVLMVYYTMSSLWILSQPIVKAGS